jgi:Cytochrome c554 and c-prime
LRSVRVLAVVLLWLVGVSAPGQVPENSAAACAGCHAAQTAQQPHTPMGEALLLPASNRTLRVHPNLSVRKGPYTYTVETHGTDSIYSVTDGTQAISIPIHWTVGQGMQTWLFERNGSYYESLVSYYPSIQGLATTVGDEALEPRTLAEAAGRKLTPGETKDCFACHSSNAVTRNGRLTLGTLQEGVTCEHCHAGASTHLFDALQGVFDTAPPSLKKLPTEDISNFCGQCHRSWEMVVRNRTRGVVDVRFQPYRLANSKCFSGTDPRIACTTCHDPHKNLVRDDASYDVKCLACHASKAAVFVHTSETSAAVAKLRPTAKACPVATANCVSCHMPKVKLPGAPITFTDHEIRIVTPGAPYPD